ncbi:hypothetical protein L7F22_044834 [Adiantum nelumboides]|nr:hypothetical protein [Adiantum nelumboides]
MFSTVVLLSFKYDSLSLPPRYRSHSRTRSQSLARDYNDDESAYNPGNNIYITGLSSRASQRDLQDHFSSEGKVPTAHLASMALANAHTPSLQVPRSTRRADILDACDRPLHLPLALAASDKGLRLTLGVVVCAIQAAEPPSTAQKVIEPSIPASPPASDWSITSWWSKKALQLPEYPNKAILMKVVNSLVEFPPLVFAIEIGSLEERLAEAALERAFLLQGEDCTESFREFNANNIRDTFRVILQMSAVLMFRGQIPAVKVVNFFYCSTEF